ncbi:CoA pyrophosphatase [Pseudomonas sp. F1_0610]|uniref:CoA pyrophosphatase n=1 Tax=Pseudomonas sp. F1_0610 TaxID=3114284 RepID=UPI0039C0234E
MLLDMVHRVRSYQPKTIKVASHVPQAAVLVPITESTHPQVILTQRATGLSTHSGEVAFPGGHYEQQDVDLIATALREAHEEVGLLPERVKVVGPLSTLMSKHGVSVTPYVGLVAEHTEYVANESEIAAIFSVPLSFFADDAREMTHRIDYQGRSWYVPSYQFEGYKIWGLTAIMLVELTNLVFGADIDLHRPPVGKLKII